MARAASLSRGLADYPFEVFDRYARGHYLTGDSGYAGVPLTAHHNTILVDGRGQGNEGKGHDAFDGFPYDRLNQIRITEARLDADSAVVRGDATAAYDFGLGLTRFVRELKFTEGSFLITDDLQARRPARFTSLLHADERIEKVNERSFAIDAGGAKLLVALEAGAAGAAAAIEDNDLTAPGPPGSVDKGERQVRGRRLIISTTAPVTQASFRLRLKVEGDAQPNRAQH